MAKGKEVVVCNCGKSFTSKTLWMAHKVKAGH